MREDDDRTPPPARAGAAVAGHEVAVLRIGAEQHAHVGRRESGGEEPLRHGAGGARRVPQRVGGIDLDQLAEDVARRLAVGGRAPRLRGRRAGDRYRRHEKRPQQDPRWIHLTLAIASISTRTAFGNAAACMVERDGLCAGKYFADTSFVAAKQAMSTRYTFVFPTMLNQHPKSM